MSSRKTKNRCWKGYKPTPGKKAFSKGSCMKEANRLIGYALIETFNRAARISAVDAERARREELYRKRVGQYPSSPDDRSRIRRLDQHGKPFKGKDGIATKGTRKRSFNQDTDNK